MPFATLLAALAEVPDPRRAQGQRYSMRHLLLFSDGQGRDGSCTVQIRAGLLAGFPLIRVLPRAEVLHGNTTG